MELSTEERVDRGINLFDQKGPKDWRNRIDTDELDVENIYLCLLGQVFGIGFIKGCEALGIEIADAPSYGLERDPDDPYPQNDYAALTDEWYQRLS